MSRYAISDIHGCLNTFRYMVEEKLQLQLTDTLYLLGDYIDRGPFSKGVIDYILDLREIGYRVQCLCGNHEDMLLESRFSGNMYDLWLTNGGVDTLRSFHATSLSHINNKYWTFLEGLEDYIELEDYWLVHAGFNFSARRPFSDRQSMLWIRDFEVDKAVLGNRKIVHGHTPIRIDQISAAINSDADVINIDGGCVFKTELGYLTSFDLDTKEVIFLKNMEYK